MTGRSGTTGQTGVDAIVLPMLARRTGLADSAAAMAGLCRRQGVAVLGDAARGDAADLTGFLGDLIPVDLLSDTVTILAAA